MWLEAATGWIDRSEFGNDAFVVGSEPGLLGLADADDLNMGGPWSERTVAVAFETSSDVDRRQMVFEMGGDLRGLNVYIDGGQVYMSVYDLWNDDGGLTTPFGPLVLNAAVTGGTAYAVILELDQGSGTVRGWVNGDAIGVRQGAGRLFQHHEDTGIGGINEDTYYHDGVRQGVAAADFFAGEVTHVLVYNRVLRSDERSALETFLE